MDESDGCADEADAAPRDVLMKALGVASASGQVEARQPEQSCGVNLHTSQEYHSQQGKQSQEQAKAFACWAGR